MTLELIEGAVDALKGYLETNFAAKVTALNAGYGDDIEIADMKAWYVAMMPRIPEYPAGVILGKEGDPEGEGEGWLKAQHEIDIIAVAKDADTEELQRKLYRYIRAVIELAKSSRDTIGYQVNIGPWDFSDVYAAQSSFLGGAKLTVFLKKYETS
jgi:hypothetical protein